MAVKQPRGYSSARRTERAQETRAAILRAARDRFIAHGYAATAVRDIAEDAGVAFPTVYAAVGNKVALLAAVFDIAVAGDDEPVALADREFVRAAEADPDPRVLLRTFTHQVITAGTRVAPILAVIDEAALSSPQIATLAERTRAGLLAGTTRLAQNLADRGALRPGLDVPPAADILWMLAGGIVQQSLIDRRGWTAEAAEDWLYDALDRLLLRP
ncbi:TetR/AcrR family transcriptional regulator [Dactylosporangium sp. NPDC051541]|uniref:TetR/AcrR family transcriptional regulator n=1 Tax=Dactylosporangium sp. NPDC051541 TaxID=3363977 RepID=UPI00378C0401